MTLELTVGVGWVTEKAIFQKTVLQQAIGMDFSICVTYHPSAYVLTLIRACRPQHRLPSAQVHPIGVLSHSA